MDKYPKIQSIFKRDAKGKFTNEYSCPEFEYLKDNLWLFTEKVDGTNIRIWWSGFGVKFGGRTDNAQIPTFLFDHLTERFPTEKFATLYHDTPMTLYGEGYGNKIQKAGKLYNPDGVDFVLFDVKIGDYWLERKDVEDVANKLNIICVPVLGEGYLCDAIDMCKNCFESTWGGFMAEGIVLKPVTQLFDRHDNRIITKVKCRDFK